MRLRSHLMVLVLVAMLPLVLFLVVEDNAEARQMLGRTLALAGFGSDRGMPRAPASGFDLYLTQPIDPAKLREVFGSLP